MTRFERFVARWLVRRIITQGYTHKENITELYKIIHEEAVNEFTEDSPPALKSYLQECFNHV